MKNIMNSFPTKSRFNLLVSLIFILSFCFNQTHAQEAIASSGGNHPGTGGSSSFTIGQLVFNNYSSPDGQIDEGVQHPYEIYVITNIDNTKINTIKVSAFPNPTTDNLFLEVNSENMQDIFYKLFDLSGKLIETGYINSNKTTINTKNLKPSTYLLSVNNNSGLIKSFKIIKTQ